MQINAAMDAFFAIIQGEAIYLENIVTIYTSTLLTVNVVLICIISYFVLRNVRLVFPLCQHCAVGSCLVNSLPIGILKKIHRFYMRNEKSMALIDDETEQKRILEAESDPNTDEDDSQPSEPNSGEAPGGPPAAASPARSPQRAISFSPARAARRSSNPRRVRVGSQEGTNSSSKRQSKRWTSTKQQKGPIEPVPLTQQPAGEEEESSHGTPAKIEVVSLTKQNLKQYVRSELGSHRSLFSIGPSAGASASEMWASGPLPVLNGTHPAMNRTASDPAVSPRTFQVDENGEEATDGVYDVQLSSVFASFRTDADDQMQLGARPPAAEPASLTGPDGDLGERPAAGDRTEDDELSDLPDECDSEESEGEGSDRRKRVELSQAATLPQRSQPPRLAEPEVCVASGSESSSDAAELWAAVARRLLRQARQRAVRPAQPRTIRGGLARAGSGITRVAGALRSMLRKTSFTQHAESRQRYHPAAGAVPDDGGDSEPASFEDHVKRAAERQLAWYFRTSVYTLVLSAVLVFCFCVWLVPQRIIHRLINTALLMRCSRFTSVGVSKSVFLVRELVLADGFSRAGPAALTARAQQSRDDLVGAITGFRLGQPVSPPPPLPHPKPPIACALASYHRDRDTSQRSCCMRVVAE